MGTFWKGNQVVHVSHTHAELYELGEKTHDFSRGMNRRTLSNCRNRKV